MKASSALTLESPPPAADSPKRKPSPWIVAPVADFLLVIATPLLIFVALTLSKNVATPEQITAFALIWAIGHHLPGMMRAYGDRALFHRFHTRFVVAPLLLLAVGIYSVTTQSSAIPLGVGLWGWWHYVMQTYGFLRIYDGKARSVAPLTCWLDQAMCLVWFAGAVMLTDNGLFGFLNLFYKAGGPAVSVELIAAGTQTVYVALVLVTAAFVLNALLRVWRGERPSFLKLALMATTFGYYWYCLTTVSNLLISYALFEMFHDAQYLTIVWAFNERRAVKDAGAGVFTRLLFRRRWGLVVSYLGLIVGYGLLNYGTREMAVGSLQQILSGVFVASTLLHYYYDGFIWKLREAETRSSLGLADAAATTSARSWRPVFTWSVVFLPLCGLTWLAIGERSHPEFDLPRHAELVAELPRCVFAHHNQGMALAAAGQLDEAEAAYRQALVLNPAYAEVHYELGIVLTRKGETDAAVAEFQKVLQLDRRHVRANYNLGVLLLNRGDLRQAVALFETALERAPRRADTHSNLGSALVMSGQRKAAIKHFRQALDINPNLTEAHSNLAGALAAEGDSKGALAHYRQALTLQPDSPAAHFNLGTFLEDQQQLNEAVAEYRAALRLDPRAGNVWNNLGVALAKQNQMPEALRAFRHAVELAPEDASAKQNLERAEAVLPAP